MTGRRGRLAVQRHGRLHLAWRGAIAGLAGAAMVTGLYPVAPHLALAALRRRRGESAPPGQLGVVAREWALAVAMSAARPLGFLGLPGGGAGPRPIIVLHGYAMNRANFLPLALRLARAGLGPIAGFEYWTLGKTASAARRLAAFVGEVRAQTGADQVDVIGHSMGGLVGRHYVALGGGDGVVANLITLGSPHSGTDVSAMGLGRPARELLFGSSMLLRLGAAPPPTRTRITTIWSRSDALVPSVREAHLHGVDEVVLDDLGHLGLLASRRVADAIVERLRR